jgi:hypothetical protein
MGVADGVYMWKEMGIDSGTMSRTLMETAMHMVQAGCEDVVQSEQPAQGGGRLGLGVVMLGKEGPCGVGCHRAA